jgi:predicted TIM-barrel fold metal-dependent hydrolase
MISRRRFLAIAGLAGAAGYAAWRAWPEQGVFNPCLGPLPDALANHALVREAWAGLDPAQVWDAHVHLLGDGGNDADAWFNDGRDTWRWPLAATQRQFFLDASCLEGDTPTDADYIARLTTLAQSFPAGYRMLLLALDAYYDAAGTLQRERTHFYLGNDYCHRVAQAAPARFEWAASVHPYRSDATAELERVHGLGARAVKWIPAAQGIDPAAPRCDPFYETLARLDLPLLSHAGTERATPGDDALSNPLLLRRAIEHGVRVVVAHCATMGQGRDLDVGEHGPWIDNFSLFERMMDTATSAGRLYGDLSAVTQTARAGKALTRIVERASEGGDWAGRVLNGSDYPLPAIMPLYSPRRLVEMGLLDAAAAAPLTTIRTHNPLMFDFVLKRHLRSGKHRLAAQAFETRRFFLPAGTA